MRDTTVAHLRQRERSPGATSCNRPAVEALEGRALLSGAGAVDLSGLPAYVRPAVPYTVSVSAPAGIGMPTAPWSGTLHFASDDPAAALPPDTQMTLAAGESATFAVSFQTPGPRSLTVTDVAAGASDRADTHVDAAAPTAKLEFSSPQYEGSLPLLLSIKVTDDASLDASASAPGENQFVAIAPNGAVLPVTWGHRRQEKPYVSEPGGPVCVCMTTGSGDVQRYGVLPADGRWDESDTGTYILRMLPGAARDRAGNEAPGGDVGTFRFGNGHDLAAWLEAVVPPTPATGTAPATRRPPRLAATLIVSNTTGPTAKGLSRATASLVRVDGETTGPARELRAWDQPVKLRAGAHRRVKLRLNLPRDLPAGTYRLEVHLRPLGGLTRVEPDDANNTAITRSFEIRVS